MSALRELVGADCGQQSALQQLSANITHVNPNVLADTRIYKQAPMAPQLGAPNPMEMQHRPPTHNDLLHEFQKTHPQARPPPPMPQMIHHQQQMINNQLQQEFENKLKINNQQQQQQGHKQHNQVMQYQAPPRPTMMGAPINMLSFQPPPNILNFHEQMYHQFTYGAQPPLFHMNQQIPRPMPQKQEQPKLQDKQQDGIKTNGEQDMKDEKTVEDELNNLKPTYSDVNAINNLLNQTQNDPKMQNSNFFNFLRKVKENPAIPDQEQDLSQQWGEEFKDWKDMTDIDDVNWQSYLDQINPMKPKDPEYTFQENNHFIPQQLQSEQPQQQEETNDKTSDEYFAEGLRLMKEGNLNEAILAFEACVKKEETRSEAWRYLGICHADNENENSGIAAYLKCIQHDPYDLDGLLQLGVSYTNEIDPYRALKYLKTWIDNHPDYSILADKIIETDNKEGEQDPNPMMGHWLGSRSEHKKIVDLFNNAVNINNQDADLHIVLGVLYNITSDYDKGEYHFKKAIQARPTDPSLWNKLGATQANGQKCPEAIKAYSKALQLKPNYVRALSNLGISFANQNKHREACQSYLASLERNPSADTVWDHLTMSLMHMNRSDLVALCDKRDPKLFKNYFKF